MCSGKLWSGRSIVLPQPQDSVKKVWDPCFCLRIAHLLISLGESCHALTGWVEKQLLYPSSLSPFPAYITLGGCRDQGPEQATSLLGLGFLIEEARAEANLSLSPDGHPSRAHCGCHIREDVQAWLERVDKI